MAILDQYHYIQRIFLPRLTVFNTVRFTDRYGGPVVAVCMWVWGICVGVYVYVGGSVCVGGCRYVFMYVYIYIMK